MPGPVDRWSDAYREGRRDFEHKGTLGYDRDRYDGMAWHEDENYTAGFDHAKEDREYEDRRREERERDDEMMRQQAAQQAAQEARWEQERYEEAQERAYEEALEDERGEA